MKQNDLERIKSAQAKRERRFARWLSNRTPKQELEAKQIRIIIAADIASGMQIPIEDPVSLYPE